MVQCYFHLLSRNCFIKEKYKKKKQKPSGKPVTRKQYDSSTKKEINAKMRGK